MTLKNKSLIIAGSVFTISTTIGQVVSIKELWIIFLVAVPNALAWGYVGYVHFIKKRKGITSQQINTINEIVQLNDRVEYGHVRSLPDLMHIWMLDEQEYKDLNIEFNLLREWWEKNNNGLFIRKKGNIIEGSIGIWPISKDFFDDLLQYHKTDTQLRQRDLISDEKEDVAVYWYISGLFLRTQEDILFEFLGKALESFLQRRLEKNIEIYISIAALKTQETILLERLDFKKVATGKKSEAPIYCYSKSNLEHLTYITNALLSARSGIDAFEKTERDKIG